MSSKGYKLFLDPGHDCDHPGNVNGGVKECDTAMQLCRRIEHHVKLLSKVGNINSKHRIDVVMSRDEVATPGIATRTMRARNIKADLLVSIHTNSVVNILAKGAECWVDDGGSYQKQSRHLAEVILNGMVALGSVSRGVKLDCTNRYGKLGMVQDVSTHMPAVLVEAAFASNPSERKKLLDPRWRENCAIKIATAIVKHFGIEPRTDLIR